MIYNHACTGL